MFRRGVPPWDPMQPPDCARSVTAAIAHIGGGTPADRFSCAVCRATSDDVVLEFTSDGLLLCDNAAACSLRFMDEMTS
jgi:hypothetical protein